MTAGPARPAAGATPLVCSGAWPPRAASRSAPGSLPRSCVPRGANDNGCGPISQPAWTGTARPGSGRRMAAPPAGAGTWGVPGSRASAGVGGDSLRGSGTLNLVSLQDAPTPTVTLIPMVSRRLSPSGGPAGKSSPAGLSGCWGPRVPPFAASPTGPHLPAGTLLCPRSCAEEALHLPGALAGFGQPAGLPFQLRPHQLCPSVRSLCPLNHVCLAIARGRRVTPQL